MIGEKLTIVSSPLIVRGIIDEIVCSGVAFYWPEPL